MINSAQQIIREAGKIILSHYDSRKTSQLKADKSPLTLADQQSHTFLNRALKQLRNIPVLSEEGESAYEVRQYWSEFWMIDPLDGTKEFINGHADFCINIALIQNNTPTLGIIYAPLLDEMYAAEKGKGVAYRGCPEKSLPSINLKTATSRSHLSPPTVEFMKINELSDVTPMGSALKFGRLALGEIDLYPRFEGSMEWDIAAGQVILEEAECHLIDLVTGQKPSYNKPNLLNNSFIAYGPRVNMEKIKFKPA